MTENEKALADANDLEDFFLRHNTLPTACIAHVRRLAAENERLAAKVAELEGDVVPGRFYRCGCPAKKSDLINAFCSVHLRVIVPDATP